MLMKTLTLAGHRKRTLAGHPLLCPGDFNEGEGSVRLKNQMLHRQPIIYKLL